MHSLKFSNKNIIHKLTYLLWGPKHPRKTHCSQRKVQRQNEHDGANFSLFCWIFAIAGSKITINSKERLKVRRFSQLIIVNSVKASILTKSRSWGKAKQKCENNSPTLAATSERLFSAWWVEIVYSNFSYRMFLRWSNNFLHDLQIK